VSLQDHRIDRVHSFVSGFKNGVAKWTHETAYSGKDIDAALSRVPQPAPIFGKQKPKKAWFSPRTLARVIEVKPMPRWRLDTAMDQPNEFKTEEIFFPRGAIAFFVLMLALYAAIWGLLYWIMIIRS
jgi:hypothetical protein